MNEREIERLLKTYGDSVQPCAVPAVQRKPLRWPRFAAAGIATVAVAGIAVLGLWPSNAAARSIARLHQALSDAKTMEFTISMKLPSGWHPYLRGYYENGFWRYDSQLGTNLESTSVKRDGMELTDYKTLDHASLDVPPTPASPSDDWQTALDFAKKGIDTGSTDIPRTVKVHDHDPIDGRPAYEITMERASEHYLAHIVVDKQTDLPIESSVSMDDVRPGFGDVPQQIHTVFQFNKPIDPQIFSLDPKDRVVVRMQDARDRLKKMWQTPLGSVAGADVRAVTVTRDGTIWIATTTPDEGTTLPDSIQDASGRRYLRAADLSPSGQLNSPAYDKIFGKAIYVTAFATLPDSRPRVMGEINGAAPVPQAVPFWDAKSHAYKLRITSPENSPARVLDLSQAEHEVTISFSHRDPSYVNPGRLLELRAEQREVLRVAPTYESGNVPSYFKLLGLDRPTFSLAQSLWTVRAQALESDKQFVGAAQAYEQLAKARYDWVKYSAYKPMLDEARCYRAIGETARAQVLVRQAEALKASRER